MVFLRSIVRRGWDGGGGLCDGRKEKSIKADNVTHREEVEDEDGSTYSEVNNFTSTLPNVIHAGFHSLDLMKT